ncbi:MAG TPA: hypothetical protein ENJ57_01505, partial [Rhizobiales bacterium]|nr:hypothetical protein [Hyphomicrobiales bacterium]
MPVMIYGWPGRGAGRCRFNQEMNCSEQLILVLPEDIAMTKPRIFFTSDTHFGDPNIIRIRKRPFDSIAEMDAAMIANWNSVVKTTDRVYHLGDFAHRDCFNGAEYLEKLNGEIHLIIGNHDDILMETAGHLFASTKSLRELDWQGRRFVLCHYPMRDWPNAVRGA